MTTVRERAEDLTAAPVPTRAHGAQWVMTVVAVTDVAPAVRRITFHANEFRGYRTNGPDEFFGLLIPRADGLVMPDPLEANLRRAVHLLPEAERPELRWYTLRAVRPDAGEADVDVVLHGDAGPGSAWACRVQVGDVAGFRQHNALHFPGATGPQLLVADETGAPALAAILDARPADQPVIAVVEVPDADHVGPLPTRRPGVDLTVVVRGPQAPGSAALAAVRRLDLPDLGYAWICGEHELATGVRRHLVRDRGIDRRRVMFSSFWTRGQARV